MASASPARIHATADLDVWSGDARTVMEALPAHSADALIVDPPYGLSSPPDINEVLTHWERGDDYEHGSAGFMNRTWDSFVPGPATWRAALRVVKPGAPAVVFAGSRTLDLMMASLRMAGWVIDGTRHWTYGSSMPKCLDVGKAIDKAAGAERTEILGVKPGHEEFVGRTDRHAAGFRTAGWDRPWHDDPDAVIKSHMVLAPVTDDAKRWEGWKTALKGAHEPIVIAHAPGGPAPDWLLSNPYTAKAPSQERVVAFVPSCSCWGDLHQMGADADLVRFDAAECTACGAPYTEYRHPTVKPLACMRELVAVCPPGGVILDPFAGTGTTGVAAVGSGRRAILVDADPVHAAMARSRFGGLQPTLFDLIAA